ncbi:MAG: trp operon repressor [Rickettsiales bacterium]|jgi:Trp operon repressor|nr:trp operon repressor [Rickettsiales bacterium]
MFNLYEAFKSINSEDEFNNFLVDLCTPKEIKDLSDRFLIAQYLYDGKLNQREVAEKTKNSITTVTRVARFLREEKYKGYETVLNVLNKKK